MSSVQKGKSSTSTLPPSASGSSTGLAEAVAWLECGGRSTAVLYREVEGLIQSAPAHQEGLFLILRHLDRVEGSLTGFIAVLETILRTSPVQVVLGDPSGYVTLVLAYLDREPQFRVFRPDPELRDPRPALIVEPARPAAELLGKVLGTFGRPCMLAHAAVDARKALGHDSYGLVLLDLDLPRMQSFGIAELVKARQPSATIVGITSAEEPWAPENSARYGIRRILAKPASILELLGALP